MGKDVKTNKKAELHNNHAAPQSRRPNTSPQTGNKPTTLWLPHVEAYNYHCHINSQCYTGDDTWNNTDKHFREGTCQEEDTTREYRTEDQFNENILKTCN